MTPAPPSRPLDSSSTDTSPACETAGGGVVRSATSVQPDARVAVREIAAALGDDADLYLAFGRS